MRRGTPLDISRMIRGEIFNALRRCLLLMLKPSSHLGSQLARLPEKVALLPADRMILLTQDGRPLPCKRESSGNWFQARRRTSRVPSMDCKARAARLAYAGATEWESAHLAHKKTKAGIRHTKKADRSKLAGRWFAKPGNLFDLSGPLGGKSQEDEISNRL